MSRKSEARARRKAEQLEAFEEQRSAFVAKVTGTISATPVVAVAVPPDGQPRVSPQVTAADQTPRATAVDNYLSQHVTWCITKADRADAWSWREKRDWDQDEWDKDIQPAFNIFVKSTWRQIDEMNSGGGHKMHHPQDVASLIKEAQNRWIVLKLDEYDTAFRFRIGGQKKHGWGYRLGAHFHFVWWERQHKIYPLPKKEKEKNAATKQRKMRENAKRLEAQKKKKENGK